MIFLIDYNRASGLLTSIREFDDALRAVAEQSRLDQEVANLHRSGVHEVVLLEAATKADLRRTHRRYFENLEDLTTGPYSVFADAA
jgi:plasmid maintenance system killer protein